MSSNSTSSSQSNEAKKVPMVKTVEPPVTTLATKLLVTGAASAWMVQRFGYTVAFIEFLILASLQSSYGCTLDLLLQMFAMGSASFVWLTFFLNEVGLGLRAWNRRYRRDFDQIKFQQVAEAYHRLSTTFPKDDQGHKFTASVLNPYPPPEAVLAIVLLAVWFYYHQRAQNLERPPPQPTSTSFIIYSLRFLGTEPRCCRFVVACWE
jgi:hypothetical protein